MTQVVKLHFFAALVEEMVAHSKTSGDSQFEKRILREERRFTANEWLGSNGKSFIKIL